MKFKEEELIILVRIEQNIKLIQSFTSFKLGNINVIDLIKSFKKKYKNKIRSIAKYFNISQRKHRSLILDVLANIKVLIQLLYYPERQMSRIPNVCYFIKFLYPIKHYIVPIYKKPLKEIKFTRSSYFFIGTAVFILHYISYDFLRNYYIKIETNIISLKLFFEIKDFVASSSLSLTTQFRYFYDSFSITYDNIYTRKITIKPINLGVYNLKRSFKIEKECFTHNDNRIFCRYLYKFLVDNNSLIDVLDVKFYVHFQHEYDREFAVSTFFYKQNIIFFIRKIMKILLFLNSEEYYHDANNMYFIVSFRSKKDILIPPFITFDFILLGNIVINNIGNKEENYYAF